jgi:flagellar hook-length control protein FliK
MSNAIPPRAQANGTGNAAAASTSSADWPSRLMADRAADGGGSSTSNSFARWMAQHMPTAQPQAAARPATAMPSANAAAAPTAKPAASADARASPTARPAAPRAQVPNSVAQAPAQTQVDVSRQAHARADAQRASQSSTQNASQQANQQAIHRASGKASEKAAAEQASDRAERNGPARTNAQAKASRTTQAEGRAQGTEEGQPPQQQGPSDENIRFTTTAGEGTAIVRELTPPPHVQTNDPAGMMAWLASLTQVGAEAPQDSGSALQPTEDDGTGRAMLLGRNDTGERRGADGLARSKAPGPTAGMSADLGRSGASPFGGEARGDVALQSDALLERGRDTQALGGDMLRGTGPGAGSDAAALLAAEGARVASFGPALGEARQALPHAQASLPTPLDAPEFTQKLSDQVSLWVGQARSDGPMTAELHLNPAEMGPINVKISLDGALARVDFAAAAPETRQALEASLSQLSSSLNDVGLSLSGGGVSSQTPQQQQQSFAQGAQGKAQGSGRAGQGDGEGVDGNDGQLGLRQVSAPRSGRLGGLDLYA